MAYTKISRIKHKILLQDELQSDFTEDIYICKLAMVKSTLQVSGYHLVPYQVKSNKKLMCFHILILSDTLWIFL